jgi:hypothetical protein
MLGTVKFLLGSRFYPVPDATKETRYNIGRKLARNLARVGLFLALGKKAPGNELQAFGPSARRLLKGQ